MLAVLAFLGALHPLQGLPLQPATYDSPDGRYQLAVDPGERYGAGPGEYTLTLEGREVWSTELPLTLETAVLTNTGTCVGFGYDMGNSAFQGDLVTALISPEGELVQGTRLSRRLWRWAICPIQPVPNGIDVLVQPELERFVVVVADDSDQGYRWLIHDLSDSRLLRGPYLPHDLPGGSELGLFRGFEAIPGTPLVLASWKSNFRAEAALHYLLLDEHDEIVWRERRALPEVAEEEEGVEPPRLFSITGEPGEFEIRDPMDRTRTLFHVARESSEKWVVRADEPAPWSPPSLEPLHLPAPEDSFPDLQLRHLGTFTLETPGAPGRGGPFERHELALLGPGNEVRLHSVLPTEDGFQLPFPRDERSLVVGMYEATLVEAGTPTVRVTRDERNHWLAGLERAAVAPDGGFGLLTEPPCYPDLPARRIHVFGPDGDARWSVRTPEGSLDLDYIALDGEELVMVGYGSAYFWKEPGVVVGKFLLPAPDEIWQPLLPRGVDEVWFYDSKRRLERYERP